MASRCLEIEWYGDGTFREKGWQDLDHLISRAQSVKLVRQVSLKGFDSIWRIRDKDGAERHCLIPTAPE
jgi:hypothetical protein